MKYTIAFVAVAIIVVILAMGWLIYFSFFMDCGKIRTMPVNWPIRCLDKFYHPAPEE